MVGWKKRTREKKRRRSRENVLKSPQQAISTSEQEGVRQRTATALLRGYCTLLPTGNYLWLWAPLMCWVPRVLSSCLLLMLQENGFQVRREKISERMKVLQRLVPGCDKVGKVALHVTLACRTNNFIFVKSNIEIALWLNNNSFVILFISCVICEMWLCSCKNCPLYFSFSHFFWQLHVVWFLSRWLERPLCWMK